MRVENTGAGRGLHLPGSQPARGDAGQGRAGGRLPALLSDPAQGEVNDIQPEMSGGGKS